MAHREHVQAEELVRRLLLLYVVRVQVDEVLVSCADYVVSLPRPAAQDTGEGAQPHQRKDGLQHLRLGLVVADPDQDDDKPRLNGELVAVLDGILALLDLAGSDALPLVLVGRAQVLQRRGSLELIMEDDGPQPRIAVVILQLLEDESRLRWSEPLSCSFFVQIHALADQPLDAVLALRCHEAVDDAHQSRLLAVVLNALRPPQGLGQQHLPHSQHAAPSDIRSQQALLEPQGVAVGEPKRGGVDQSGGLVVLAVVAEDPCVVGVLIVEAEVDRVRDFEVLLLPA